MTLRLVVAFPAASAARTVTVADVGLPLRRRGARRARTVGANASLTVRRPADRSCADTGVSRIPATVAETLSVQGSLQDAVTRTPVRSTRCGERKLAFRPGSVMSGRNAM